MDQPENDIEPVPPRRPPSRRGLILALAPIVVVSLIATVGRGLRPTLIAHHPLLLLAIEPATPYMVLVQNRIDPFSFYFVVIVRRLMLDPIYFMLGRWYGNKALHWLQRQAPGMGDVVVFIERHFPKYGPLIVTIYPQPLVFVIAGASRMRFWVFMVCDVINTVAITYFVRHFGHTVQGPAGSLTHFITRYSVPLTVISIALVVIFMFTGRNSGGPVPNISGMADQLEETKQNDPTDPHDTVEKPNHG